MLPQKQSKPLTHCEGGEAMSRSPRDVGTISDNNNEERRVVGITGFSVPGLVPACAENYLAGFRNAHMGIRWDSGVRKG